ncbi:MAG: hypothetical protein JSV69_14940 [Chloroflexota bacterium]|nr:MAG: hypothetical protein JSV69_14940 [Chloroflexota bacterium]
MDEAAFRNYLKKGGRSTSSENRCIRFLSGFEDFLIKKRSGKNLENADSKDLVAFVLMVEEDLKTEAKGYLRAIRYY